jgi:ribosomal protein S18 acetylase RimI-like enzyme
MGEPRAWFVERLQSSAVFGAFSDRGLLGVAGFYAHTGVKTRHKGVLWGMYVRPSARGVGTGKLLVRSVIEHARQHVELLQLTVVSTNLSARRLYEALGFAEYGMEPHALKHPGGKYFDEVLMFRFL